MEPINASTWLTVTVHVALIAQLSIICLIIFTDTPSQSVVGAIGRITVLLAWLAITSNFLINYPNNFDDWLGYFALLLITLHGITFLRIHRAIRYNSTTPVKDYLGIMVYGVLYSQMDNLRENWTKVSPHI